MRECGAPTFRSSDGVLASGEAGRGAALGVSISALAGFLSWCAVTGVDPLVFPQDRLFSRQLLAAGSYDRQTP
jgi:hypothetical protein